MTGPWGALGPSEDALRLRLVAGCILLALLAATAAIRYANSASLSACLGLGPGFQQLGFGRVWRTGRRSGAKPGTPLVLP